MHGFLLTLPFVEPQHTASKHRHGRGHEGGERGGGPWTVAGDPQEGGKMGVLVVKCEGFGVGRGVGTNTNVQLNTNVQMEGQQ